MLTTLRNPDLTKPLLLFGIAGICAGYMLNSLNANSYYKSEVQIISLPKVAASELPAHDLNERVIVPLKSINLLVDRRRLLRELFSHITASDLTDQGKIEAWVVYLQNWIADPNYVPIFDNGQAITDPLWILQHRMGQCGQINRLVVDGLAAAGYKARVVQLKGHVAAEVWLEGSWRFLDADILSFGEFIRHTDGTLVSADEISKNPKKFLAGLHPGLEYRMYPNAIIDKRFDSRFLQIYADTFSAKPYYYVKTATAEQEKNPYYGWNYYKAVYQ